MTNYGGGGTWHDNNHSNNIHFQNIILNVKLN
jgi:hypothetical protein